MSETGIAIREFRKLGIKPNALLTAAQKHEATLHRINVEPLSTINVTPPGYLHWFDHLFLLTFFYDYCLDRANEEQFPEAFFISTNMYFEYRSYVEATFGDEGINLLDEHNAAQLYYQTIEKQWLNPMEYHRTHPNYNNYYKKQILCMSHLKLLALRPETSELSTGVITLYKHYWTLILLIDDLMDVDRDIANRTLTPMIADYYVKCGSLPEPHEADSLRRKWTAEIEKLLPGFEESARKLNATSYLNIIDSLMNKLDSK